jgi:hypothetical protein
LFGLVYRVGQEAFGYSLSRCMPIFVDENRPLSG